MTPEAQRIAIAEACGWERNEYSGCLWYHPDSPFCQDGRYASDDDLPDYLNDLNATNEAEKTLDGYMMLKYASELLAITGGAGTAGSFSHIHANAVQRAEAFLKTIGRWEQ